MGRKRWYLLRLEVFPVNIEYRLSNWARKWSNGGGSASPSRVLCPGSSSFPTQQGAPVLLLRLPFLVVHFPDSGRPAADARQRLVGPRRDSVSLGLARAGWC